MSAPFEWRSGWAFPESALDPLRQMLMPGGPASGEVPILGSWSLGSFQSLETAIRNPGRARALVLIASTARFCACAEYPTGQPEAALRALQRNLGRDPRAALEAFHTLCAAPARLDETELRVRTEQSLALGLPQLEEGLCVLRTTDLRASLAGIKLPVLVLHGEADQVIPLEAARVLASGIPGARLATRPGAGHDLPLRCTDWVAQQIRAFAELLR